MISVKRDDSNKPAGFDQRRIAREQALKKARAEHPKLTVSKHWSAIRRGLQADGEALYDVFLGKCAFCEAKMAHVSSPHIEHYRPKGKPEFEQFVFRWENWLLSCGQCNESKWAHFPDCQGEPCLIDPTVDNPDQHLDFIDQAVVGKTQRGEETIHLIGLDRSPLVDERSFWLLQIDSLLLLCLNPSAKSEARELLIWAMQRDAPYTAMTRRYLAARAPKLAHPTVPHPRLEIDKPRQRMKHLIEQYQQALGELL